MKKMKYSILSSLIGLALLSSCGGRSDSKASDTPEADSAAAGFVISASSASAEGVIAGAPAVRPFYSAVRGNGTLRVMPEDRAEVASPVGANIRRILVREGQKVRRGQTLALVAHPDLLELQGRYLSAVSRMGYVRQEYERQKRLYAQHIGAGKDFQQITSEYEQLGGEIRVTGRQLALLGISTSSLSAGHTVSAVAVKSPIDGTVERVNAAVGQYADPQSPLFSVINSHRVYADVLLYENDFSKVKEGCSVTLESGSWSGKVSGKVTSVGSLFDDGTRAVHVRIALSPTSEHLTPGAYISASIHSGVKNRPAVSAEASATDGGRTYVFLVKREGKNLRFTPREVKLGQSTDGYSEVLSGLSAGDRIAVSGAYVLMSEWKKAEAGE